MEKGKIIVTDTATFVVGNTQNGNVFLKLIAGWNKSCAFIQLFDSNIYYTNKSVVKYQLEHGHAKEYRRNVTTYDLLRKSGRYYELVDLISQQYPQSEHASLTNDIERYLSTEPSYSAMGNLINAFCPEGPTRRMSEIVIDVRCSIAEHQQVLHKANQAL